MDFLSLSGKTEIPIHLNYIKVEKDIYQQGGLMLPGYFTKENPLPKNVTATLVVLKRYNKFNQDGCIKLINSEGCGIAINHTIQDIVSRHAQRNFTLNDDTNPKKANPTFPDKIITNRPSDMDHYKGDPNPIAISDISEMPSNLTATLSELVNNTQETLGNAIELGMNKMGSV